MKEEKFWQEGMDGKRFASVFSVRYGCFWLRPHWRGGGRRNLSVPGPGAGRTVQYQVFSQYRIYFDKDKYGEIADYYNAYTWGEIMRTDQVVDFVMEAFRKHNQGTGEGIGLCGQMNDIKVMLYISLPMMPPCRRKSPGV